MRKQFRDLISVDEARDIVSKLEIEERAERLELDRCPGKALAEDIYAKAHVPPFGKSLMDGYAVVASDTYRAEEDDPVQLSLTGEVKIGEMPGKEVTEGECLEIATGAPLPKGGNAVVMVEDTEEKDGYIHVRSPVSPGENVFGAASDISQGEKLLSKGTKISPTDVGLIASVGLEIVEVFAPPRVGVISTGPELVEAGADLDLGQIYDTNSYLLVAGIKKAGGEPVRFGIVGDDREESEKVLRKASKETEVVITSGGTSAGAHDIIHRIIEEYGEVMAHGIKIKPGKPTILARLDGTPFFGLPGNPSSAYSVFRELVAPFINRSAVSAGSKEERTVSADMTQYVRSEGGRMEQKYVGLVRRNGNFKAYPIDKVSGAVTLLSEADGYVEIPEGDNYLDENETVKVKLIAAGSDSPKILAVGSNCLGMDKLLSMTEMETKNLNRGSISGVRSMAKGVGDLAGIHIWSPEGYNIPFLKDYEISDVVLIRGYKRQQGLILKKGNPSEIDSLSDLLDKDLRMVNRNSGSGTRLLIDHLLGKLAGQRGKNEEKMKNDIAGYRFEVNSHNAVAVAVKTGKADLGLGIETVARMNDLDFVPIREESYDILARKGLMDQRAGIEVRDLLRGERFEEYLSQQPGLKPDEKTGNIIQEF